MKQTFPVSESVKDASLPAIFCCSSFILQKTKCYFAKKHAGQYSIWAQTGIEFAMAELALPSSFEVLETKRVQRAWGGVRKERGDHLEKQSVNTMLPWGRLSGAALGKVIWSWLGASGNLPAREKIWLFQAGLRFWALRSNLWEFTLNNWNRRRKLGGNLDVMAIASSIGWEVWSCPKFTSLENCQSISLNQ